MLVALLAEGVDRNSVSDTIVLKADTVALLAEGVDRNRVDDGAFLTVNVGRPPRGGRG